MKSNLFRFQGKKLGFLMFHCMLLALACQKEKGDSLIILRVWNNVSCEFILFSIHSLCLI